MSETVNVRTLRNEYARLIARAEAGEAVTIVRRGRPVARLVPIADRAGARVNWDESAAHARRLPRRLLKAEQVREVLDESRGRY